MNNNFSLTKATEILLKYYNLWSENISKDVLVFNTHKIRHIIWVLETWRNLLIKMKENQDIPSEYVKNAELIFIFHDLWRFYQNDKIKVVPDSIIDHWMKSWELTNLEWYDKKIYLSIIHHNRYKLDWLFEEKDYIKMSDEDKKETLFLTKILRDADKLQNMIYTIFDIEMLTKLNPDITTHWNINSEVIGFLKQNIPVDRKCIKTIWDNVTWLLWRIFDINFKESIDMLNYYWYVDKIINELYKFEWVSSEKVDEIKEIFSKYEKK